MSRKFTPFTTISSIRENLEFYAGVYWHSRPPAPTAHRLGDCRCGPLRARSKMLTARLPGRLEAAGGLRSQCCTIGGASFSMSPPPGWIPWRGARFWRA